MTLLILGLILWVGAHFFKRLAPNMRANMTQSMGRKSNGIFALIIVVSLVLMVVGYRACENIYVYTPPVWGIHANNVMMVVAIVLFGMSATTGRLRGRMRHPMLTGVRVWALAHLLVNGDLASLVLFGTLTVWAMVQTALINHGEGTWDRPEPGAPKGDVRLVIISAVMFAIMVAVHYALGYPTFMGGAV